ncbi:MAG TPA: SIMPL domain-containing protein [Acetobacteraceae bacterium]|nr:SIMPL domain-containing protein [Acetobacteraceae bacterium]
MARPAPRRRDCLAALLGAALLLPASAQAETLLRLSSTATVSVQPDELAASLSAQATAAAARQAQARVNQAVGTALEAAHAVAGVQVATGSYQVWHVTEPHEQWQASQSITLSSHDGDSLLGLVGKLQAQGLAVNELAWRLSPGLEQRSHDEATRRAVTRLRGRAVEMAALLGLRFDSFREVRLTPEAPPPMPRAMMAMAAMPAPHAESGQVEVSATVEADAVLVPK